ncbi:MAG: sporulation protein YabP [Bacilli bacterium]
MDKNHDIEHTFNHSIQVNDRKTAVIAGVKKLENFDNTEFYLESVQGFILIKGEELELIKLDTFAGTLSLKGKINSIMYLENGNKKQKGESVIAKLFK